MKTVSYAQNYEDVLLNRLFRDRPGGFYIDVGACHPVFHSVTKLFYDRGWQGVNIEPIPSMFKLLADDRPRDVNLHMGLSNVDGNQTFYEFPSMVGFSTFSQAHADSVRRNCGHEFEKRSISVSTLAHVCEQYASQTIEFLKIDVEGHEREVLEGGNWGRYRPRVVLIEATRPDNWEHILLSSDYLFALFDGLNRFYVRAEDSQLLQLLKVPVNLFDDFEPYEYLRPIQELRQALEATQARLEAVDTQLETARACLAHFEELGPIAIGVARRIRRISARSPRLASLAKRVIRQARELVNGRDGEGLRRAKPRRLAG